MSAIAGMGHGARDQKASASIESLILKDSLVADALSKILAMPTGSIMDLMQLWMKPILKVRIPGSAGRTPNKDMMDAAKQAVLRFYAQQEAQGQRSDVVMAFYLASGELNLRFDWADAMNRVRRARFDRTQSIDQWLDAFAMSSGDTNSQAEIYVCGTKPITLRALTSLICHEGLHNLARRTRPGNPYLSEDTEHVAMALLGDPQLVDRSFANTLAVLHGEV